MPEKPEQDFLIKAREKLAEFEDLLAKIDNKKIKPEKVAKDYDSQTISQLISALGISMTATAQDSPERMQIVNRYRFLQKAERISLISGQQEK